MRTVDVRILKNQLGRFLTYVKNGDEVVILERDVPVAKLVRFSAEKRKLVLPAAKFNLKQFLKMPAPRVAGRKAIRALLAERESGA